MDNNRIINYINEFKEYVNVLENTQISSLYGEDIFPALMGKVFSLSVGDTLDDENSLMEKLTQIHTETTINERKFLYNFFKKFWNGNDNVLEVGPFLGGSTRAMAMGMLENKNRQSSSKLITYDKFSTYYKAEDLLNNLQPMFNKGILNDEVKKRILDSTSFLEVFELIHEQSDYYKLINPIVGKLPDSKDMVDPSQDGFFKLHDELHYSVVFVDGAKSWFGMKYFMTEVLKKTNKNGYFLFQDYGAHTCFWVPLFVEIFREHFKLICYVDHTYTFKLINPLDPKKIERDFPDSPLGFSWEDYDRIFNNMKKWAVDTNNHYTLMNYELQHAAALAYIGHLSEARKKIINMLDTPFASKYKGWILNSLRIPTYTPEGSLNLF